LFDPPNVAGWAGGRTWITPATLLQRGNLFRDVLSADAAAFRPPDRQMPATYARVGENLKKGMNITEATKEGTGDAESNMMADRDEDFNTRYASYRGWQMAVEKVKPIPRNTARLDLSGMVISAGCKTSADVVDYFARRFLLVPMDSATRTQLVDFLTRELATDNLEQAQTYMEDPLRVLLHLIMSMPEYQLG